MFLLIVERIFAVILFAVVFFQVIIPLLFGQPMFPWLRRVRKLDERLGEAKEEVILAKGEKEIDRTLRKAGINPNQPNDPPTS